MLRLITGSFRDRPDWERHAFIDVAHLQRAADRRQRQRTIQGVFTRGPTLLSPSVR